MLPKPPYDDDNVSVSTGASGMSDLSCETVSETGAAKGRKKKKSGAARRKRKQERIDASLAQFDAERADGQQEWAAAGDRRCGDEQRLEQGFGSGSRDRGRATTRAAHLLAYAGGKCERLALGAGAGGGIRHSPRYRRLGGGGKRGWVT